MWIQGMLECSRQFLGVGFRPEWKFYAVKLGWLVSRSSWWVEEECAASLDSVYDILHHGVGEPVVFQRPYPESVPVMR